MVIDRTKVKPNFYIEIKEVDVSDFVVAKGSFQPNSKNKIGKGSFVLDISNGLDVKKYQEVGFFVQYDNKYKRFGGVISDVGEDIGNFRVPIRVKGFAWLFYQTDFTGIFRDDAGKGNRKTIITDILSEKFPNIYWDDESFPDIDASFDIIYQIYNVQKPGDIFDELVKPLSRDWWVDDTGKFFCRVREYTQVNQPVTLNVNTFGVPGVDVNNKYANIVKVFGAKFEKEYPYEFSGTGAADEFDLDFVPSSSNTVEYSDGTRIRVTIEGNEKFDDPTTYDAYFKLSDRKIKFNVNTTIGVDNIIVKTKVYDQIREEVPRASEIDRIGFEKIKKITSEDITTQEDAYNIGNSYLNEWAKDQPIYFTGVKISNDDQLRDWKLGNAVPLDLGRGAEYQNIIEEIWNFDKQSGGFTLSLRFVDFKKTDSDIVNDLLLKIRIQESVIDRSTTNITRYFYVGNNIVMVPQNRAIETQADDDRFQMQSINQDSRSWMSRTGVLPPALGGGPAHIMRRGEYNTEKVMLYSFNDNNTFIENFYDDFFIDYNTTTAKVDTINHEVIF